MLREICQICLKNFVPVYQERKAEKVRGKEAA